MGKEPKFGTYKGFSKRKDAEAFAKEKRKDGRHARVGKGGLRAGLSNEYGVVYW